MKKLLTLTVLIFTLISCGGPGKKGETTSEGDTANVSQPAAAKAPKSKWTYSERVDEMTDSKTYHARIEANEELNFSFPYNGGTKVWITLRKNSSGTDILLSIPKNKGQFIPSAMGDRSILVRFDDKPAEKYSYTDPSDYSAETIFIKNANKFIENLKASQKTIIQCEFFNEGVQTIKFDTHGLEWNH